jgi:hypothetical protein
MMAGQLSGDTAQPPYFREIPQLPEAGLVHSQKNHDLAHDSTDWCPRHFRLDKCSLLFLNDI